MVSVVKEILTSSQQFMSQTVPSYNEDNSLPYITACVILLHGILFYFAALTPTHIPEVTKPIKHLVVKTINLEPRPSPKVIQEPKEELFIAAAEPIHEPKPIMQEPIEEEIVAVSEPEQVEEAQPTPEPVKEEPKPPPEPVKPKEPKPKEKKPEPVKKKPEPKKAETKKAEPKKVEPKKETPKVEPKKKTPEKPKTNPPKETKKAKDTSKKTPAKKEKSEAPPKPDPKIEAAAKAKEAKRRELVAQAQKSIGKVGSSNGKIADNSESSIASTAIPDKINTLHVMTALAEIAPGLSDQEATYSQKLASFLQMKLRLPESGEVRIRLTLERSGNFNKVAVVSSKSDKNKKYVEKELPKLNFPSFGKNFEGKEQYTFNITLKNEY